VPTKKARQRIAGLQISHVGVFALFLNAAAAAVSAAAGSASAARVCCGALSATKTARSAGRAPTATARAGAGRWLAWQETFALQFLSGQLAGAAYGFGLLARSFLGWLLKMSAELHLAENALTLQFFLERLESLIDVVVAYENLQADVSSDEFRRIECTKTPAPVAFPPEPAPVLRLSLANIEDFGNRAGGATFIPAASSTAG
jgi:hypothetical protein